MSVLHIEGLASNRKERLKVSICPECMSDNIDQRSSIALRVVCALILIVFVPLGIFIAWVPFVLPIIYQCNKCGVSKRKEEMETMDWRDKETFTDEYQMLEQRLLPYFNTWIEDQDNQVAKLIKAESLFLLLYVTNEQITLHRIKEIDEVELPLRLHTVHLTGNHLKVARNNYLTLTEFGKKLLTDEEAAMIHNEETKRGTKLRDWLRVEDRIAHIADLQSEKMA
ncbi:hypothetical protein [Salsuginibacillus kocurii]|uniref:hypothetical protein n=1 Tax=Salsuginibacillus kocurii TaxID=427078 RepID=UPI00036A8337|nr:hypothetical protein [Salsuginibacillus kocurii]